MEIIASISQSKAQSRSNSQDADAKLSDEYEQALSSQKDFFLGSGREYNREIEYLFSDPILFSPSGIEKRNKPPKFVTSRQELKFEVIQPA